MVKVRVEEELLCIPVTSPGLSVGALAAKAASSYSRAAGGAEPLLSLTTADGALLDPGDPVVAVVLPSAPLLLARVTGWLTKAPDQRYEEFCRDSAVTNFKNIRSKLAASESSGELVLSNSPLRGGQAAAVLSALTSCSTLTLLTLSGCKLTDTCLHNLASCLASLPCLTSLDLSSNMLTVGTVEVMASLQPLATMRTLNLNRNMLGGRSLPDLSLAFPHLSTLSLKSSHLSRLMARGIGHLTTLDISLNPLGASGLRSLLAGGSTHLAHLTLAGCLEEGDRFAASDLPQFAPHLTHLDLSNLGLTDAMMGEVGRNLASLNTLSHLVMSHNKVTTRGVVTLLVELTKDSTPLANLVVAGFEPATFWAGGSEELCAALSAALAAEGPRLKELVVPVGRRAELGNVWRAAWGAAGRVLEADGHTKLALQ